MQASMRTLIRAVGLSLGYYLGFSVGVPLMLAFDAWSIVPLWACMLIAALAEFVHAVWVVWRNAEDCTVHPCSEDLWGSAQEDVCMTRLVSVPVRWERRAMRTVIGVNMGPNLRRKQFARRQVWQPRRTMGR